MNRSRRFFIALAAAALAVSPACAAPRNVLFILADDLGWGELGCYGQKKIRTPNLDQLAKEGTRFTNFHVAQAVCSASRAGLMTGCYPNRVGIHGALGPKSKT